MKLQVIGSGDASNGAGRGHSCYWLDAEQGALMIDFGGTALAGIHTLGRSPLALDALVFTHLHGDHIGGFPYLYVDAMYGARRSKPLLVAGPVGTQQRLEALLGLTYGGLLKKAPAFEVQFTELAPGDHTELCGLRLEAFPADHQDPPEQPLCLRFSDSKGSGVAFSGDTRICAGLLAAAREATLLVAECTELSPSGARHCNWEDWLGVFPQLDVQRILLSHLSREVREALPDLRRQAPAKPRIQFADDGLQIEL